MAEETAPSSPLQAVNLYPFDPESQEHVNRLLAQRVSCGWYIEAIESWRERQRSGNMSLQWIAIAPTNPHSESLLKTHTTTYPAEITPITDSALSFARAPRTPSSPPTPFHPIGHISLDTTTTPHVYRITSFYISRALHSQGLGRAAMDRVEEMAIASPLYATRLTLNAIARDYPGKKERAIAFGRTAPMVIAQDWYERRGYKVVGMEEGVFPETDKQGKVWLANSVEMEKVVV